ncbi:hypothetical protein [Weissella minor]|uniref:hypothetical protein n=1 Tax=Weissella minor TaxID=1620 RepID=UPI003AF20AAD
MKRIEKLGKWYLIIVVGLVLGLLVWGITSSWNSFKVGDFTETPGITYEDIQHASKDQKILLVIFERNSKQSRALKPLLKKAEQQNTESDVKVAYIDANSQAGKKITPTLPIESKDLPIIVPIKDGTSNLVIQQDGKETIPGPASSKRLIGNTNSDGTYQVNEELLDQYFAGVWTID